MRQPFRQYAPYVPLARRIRQRTLEQQADEILAADKHTTERRRSGRQATRRVNKPMAESSTPRRYTLADLPLLRRRGLIP